MVEYSVVLHQHPGSPRPDITVFCSEDREEAIREMRKYDKQHGFSYDDGRGGYSVADILLVEQERIVGAPVLSVTSYIDLFDVHGDRRKTENKGGIS